MGTEAALPQSPDLQASAPPGAPVSAPRAAGRSSRPGRWLRRLLTWGVLLLPALVIVGLVAIHLWAWHHFRAGQADLERYRTVEAQGHLQACLKVWPRHGPTLLLSARAARRQGAFDDAEGFLARYQEAHGQDDDLVFEQVLLRAERGEVDDVSKYCEALLLQKPAAAPLILEALAHGCMRMLRLFEAEAYLQRWFHDQPDNLQAQFFQGLINEQLDRPVDALARFRRVVELDAEHDAARRHLCAVLLQLRLAEEARPHLEYLMERDPDNLRVKVYLARCHDQLGHQDEAEKLLDEVLEHEPRYAPALAERGKLAMRSGQTAQAEAWLRRAILYEPGDYQSYYQLSLCLLQSGRKEELEEVQNKMKQIQLDVHRIQEIVNVRMQESPHDPALHYEAGVITLRAGALAEGLRWLQSALKEDPNYAPAHKALADFYESVGEFGRAARHRRLAQAATTAGPGVEKGKEPR